MLKSKYSLPTRGAGFVVLISFIYSLAGTISIPVFSLYIESLVGEPAYVGYFMSLIYFMILVYILISTYFLRNFNKITILRFSMLGSGIGFLLLTIVNNAFQLLIIEIFRALFIALNFIVIGILIRDGSKKSTISKNEGFYFAIINMSFFIGPIIGGLLADAYSIKIVFLISAIFPLLVFFLLLTKKRKEEKTEASEIKIFDNIKEYCKSKDQTINYIISLGLLSWLAIIYSYMPLYMNQEGLNEKTIGYFLALTVLPLIILEIPISKLSEKTGYRKLFFLGFLLIGIFGILGVVFKNIYLTLLSFVLTNLGVAFVEPLKEAYFFKISKRSDEIKYYPVFKTSSDVGHLTGPLIFSTVLLFTNFKTMFLVASIIMIILGFISLKLKEVKK